MKSTEWWQVLLSDPELGKDFNFSQTPFDLFEDEIAITQVSSTLTPAEPSGQVHLGSVPGERIVHATISHPPHLLGNSTTTTYRNSKQFK